MGQGDQPVGLAAAVGGVEAEDRRGVAGGAAQAAADALEEAPEAAGGVGVLEEPRRVPVVRRGGLRLVEDGGEVGGELVVGDSTLQDLLPGLAEVEDGRGFHGSLTRSGTAPLGVLGGRGRLGRGGAGRISVSHGVGLRGPVSAAHLTEPFSDSSLCRKDDSR